jgi:hypothetical protein
VKENDMTPGAVRILDHWASSPDFRALTVAEAAAQLQEVLPHYPHPNDQPVAICVNGYRWFVHEMEAVADAIYRASRRPHELGETLAGADWDADVNEQGLWALPGRCSRRTHNERVRQEFLMGRSQARPGAPLPDRRA